MQRLARYFKEREDFDCVLTDEGFASYKITGEECYIRDIWVDFDYRKKSIASEMADDIAEIARKAGCRYLTGSVNTTLRGFEQNIKILEAYGLRIVGAVQGGIYFRKDL